MSMVRGVSGLLPAGFGAVPDLGEQSAALCYRVARRGVQVLLVTSRDTGRWVLPKGWLADGLRAGENAAREAFEEAGVEGVVQDDPVGSYSYLKLMPHDRQVLCHVTVHPLEVDRLRIHYPEEKQRQRKWALAAVAETLVQELQLQEIIRVFASSFPLPRPAKRTWARRFRVGTGKG